MIVEQSSRLVQLAVQPEDYKATLMRIAIIRKIIQLSDQLARSLTWD